MDRLLVLCGDTDERLEGFDVVVTWCPVRHRALTQRGVENHLFGDFSPGEERGQSLDCWLHERLEDGLQKQAQADPRMRWLPLALQQTKWPLARYIWLKECARRIFQTFPVSRCVVSSADDSDIATAVAAVAAESRVRVDVRSGPFDGSSSSLYREALFGVPTQLDPRWLFQLQWRLIAAWRRGIDVLMESYPNLRGWLREPGVYLFNLDRALSIVRLARNRLLGLARKRVVIRDGRRAGMQPTLVDPACWKAFSEDERQVINGAVAMFLDHYGPEFLDEVASRFRYMFSVLGISRLVLAVDQLDADRLLTRAAKLEGIGVDYLPHGLLIEADSGRHRDSPFCPDRVLAWNAGSRNVFERLGWDAIHVRHPVNQRPIAPLKPLEGDSASWKVLVLLPEWVIVSLGGREDCAMRDFLEVYDGLTGMGVSPLHIHAKYHGTSGVREAEDAKAIHLDRMRRLLEMRFHVLDSSVRVRDVMSEYHLIVVGPTTGILEAVLRGIPVVLFGDGFGRVGALEGCALPRARTAGELRAAVQSYLADGLGTVYQRLAASLQAGPPMTCASLLAS